MHVPASFIDTEAYYNMVQHFAFLTLHDFLIVFQVSIYNTVFRKNEFLILSLWQCGIPLYGHMIYLTRFPLEGYLGCFSSSIIIKGAGMKELLLKFSS